MKTILIPLVVQPEFDLGPVRFEFFSAAISKMSNTTDAPRTLHVGNIRCTYIYTTAGTHCASILYDWESLRCEWWHEWLTKIWHVLLLSVVIETINQHGLSLGVYSRVCSWCVPVSRLTFHSWLLLYPRAAIDLELWNLTGKSTAAKTFRSVYYY